MHLSSDLGLAPKETSHLQVVAMWQASIGVVSPLMSSTTDLERWVRAQYHTFGVDQEGHFIGKKRFKSRLIDRYPTINGGKVPKQEIRRLVNR